MDRFEALEKLVLSAAFVVALVALIYGGSRGFYDIFGDFGAHGPLVAIITAVGTVALSAVVIALVLMGYPMRQGDD